MHLVNLIKCGNLVRMVRTSWRVATLAGSLLRTSIIRRPRRAPSGRAARRAMGCASSTQTAPARTGAADGDASGGVGISQDDARRKSVVIDVRRQINFDAVMDDVVAIEHLLEFAKKEFNEENLLFWIDVMKLKRDLADTTLWDGSVSKDAVASSATSSSQKPADADPFGEPPDPFGAPPGDGGDIFGGDNIFDMDKATHKSGTGAKRRFSAVDALPPPEAGQADRLGFLRRRCQEIVDNYLCNGAPMQVTMPDHKYKAKCSSAKPPYEFALDESSGKFEQFDKFAELAYKTVRRRCSAPRAAHVPPGWPLRAACDAEGGP